MRIQGWTPRQRMVLIAAAGGLIGYSIVRYAVNPKFVDDPQPVNRARAEEVADRLDPNIADAAALAALPELGEKRARAVVAYREEYARGGRGPIAFRQASDLLRVRGIGLAMLANLQPYLIFPASTSQPATIP